MDVMDLDTMAEIQGQKATEEGGQLPLDDEGREVAEKKRFAIDLGEYTVAKTDPLR